MACPWTTLTDWHTTGHKLGTEAGTGWATNPSNAMFLSSGDYVYVWCDSFYDDVWHFHRATLANFCTPANWTTVGSGEFDATGEFKDFSFYQDGDTLHVRVTVITTNTEYSSTGWWYNTFGMHDGSTEVGWGTGELIKDDADDGVSTNAYTSGIHVRSSGEVVVTVPGDGVRNMGTWYGRPGYAERSTGGTWTVTDFITDTSTEANMWNADVYPSYGSSDCLTANNYSTSSTSREFRKLADNGTLGSRITAYNYFNNVTVVDDDGDVHSYTNMAIAQTTGVLTAKHYIKNFVLDSTDVTLATLSGVGAATGYVYSNRPVVDGSDLYFPIIFEANGSTDDTWCYAKSATAASSADRTWTAAYTDFVVDTSNGITTAMFVDSGTKYVVWGREATPYNHVSTPSDDIPPVSITYNVDFQTTKIYDDMSDYEGVLDPAVQDGYGSDLYLLTWNGENTYSCRIQMWKCPDGDDPKAVANWDEVGPSLTLDIAEVADINRSYGSPIGRRMVFDSSDNLHIALAGLSSNVSQSMFYRRFDTSTDTWVTAEAVTLYDDVNDRVYDPQIAIRPSNDQPIIQTGLSDYSPFTYIGHGMSYRTGTATWTNTIIDSSSDGSNDQPNGIVCADDMCYLYVANYGDVTPQVDYQFQACYYSFNSSNSLGSRTQFTTYTTTGRGTVRPFYVTTDYDGSVWRHLVMTSEDNANIDAHDIFDLHTTTGAGSTLSFTTNTFDTHPTTTWHALGRIGQQVTYSTDLSRWEYVDTITDRDDYPPNIYLSTVKYVVNESGTTGSYFIQLIPWTGTADPEYSEITKFNSFFHKIIKRDGSRYTILSDKTDGAFYYELLFDAQYVDHGVDFQTTGITTIDHDVDFILFQLTKTIDHSIDFLLYDPNAISPTVDHLVDFYLVERVTDTHDVDFFVIAQPEVAHDVDFVLIETTQVTIAHNIDFILTGEIAISTTMTMSLGVAADQVVELPPDVTGDKTNRKKHPTPKIIK